MNKIFIIILTIQTIIFSCSSNNSNTNSNIFNGDYDNLSLNKESFDKIGFKFSKEYNVKGNWKVYADSQGINYKKLFDSMEKDGMKHPVMVRKLNGSYRKWQAGGRRIIWAKMNNYTHIGAYVLDKQEQVDEIYAAQYDESYK